jgi:hypothetical protein
MKGGAMPMKGGGYADERWGHDDEGVGLSALPVSGKRL